MANPLDDKNLEARMQKLGIRAEDLEETFSLGTGPGGQKINKTSSTVVLVHVPTGLEVRCQKERSQAMNRLVARELLFDKIEATLAAARQERRDAVEKKRRQNRPRPRGLKERILKDKHARGEIKKTRSGPIRRDD